MSTERNRLYRTLQESWNGMRAPQTVILCEGVFDDMGRIPTQDELLSNIRVGAETVGDEVDPAAAQMTADLILKMMNNQPIVSSEAKKAFDAYPQLRSYIQWAIEGFDPDLWDKLQDWTTKAVDDKDMMKGMDSEDPLDVFKTMLGGTFTGPEAARISDRPASDKMQDIKSTQKGMQAAREQEEAIKAQFQAGEIDVDEAVQAIAAVHGHAKPNVKMIKNFLAQGTPEAEVEFPDEMPDDDAEAAADEFATGAEDEDEMRIAESKYASIKSTNIDKQHRLLKESWKRMGK